MSEDFLYVEKYRPKTIAECILPQHIKKVYNEYLDKKEIQHLLLSGQQGIGKTSSARALCNELETDVLFINGSEESGIDVLRTTIRDYASTVSLMGNKKVVIIDEADYLNQNSTQPALRAFMEEFANTCKFILTCNYKNRILPAIHSRCNEINFNIPVEEIPSLKATFLKKIVYILKTENITFDIKVVARLIEKFFPDFRKTLNELQKYSLSGHIDSGILIKNGAEDFGVLVSHLIQKSYTEVRKWINTNSDIDHTSLFDYLYTELPEILQEQSIPQLVLHLGDYQKNALLVANQQINSLACITEIMRDCSFK